MSIIFLHLHDQFKSLFCSSVLYITIFMTNAGLVLDADRQSVPHHSCFTYRKETRTPCTGSWVDPRAGLEWCGKLCSHWIRSPNPPAHSKLLFCIWYPDSLRINGSKNITNQSKFLLNNLYFGICPWKYTRHNVPLKTGQ